MANPNYANYHNQWRTPTTRIDVRELNREDENIVNNKPNFANLVGNWDGRKRTKSISDAADPNRKELKTANDYPNLGNLRNE